MSNDSRHFQLLLDQVREGSNEAARVLEQRYGDHILRIVRRKLQKSMRSKFDSIDFVQIVWASFFADPSRIPAVRTPDDLASWLGVLAANKVADEGRHLQTQKRDLKREVRIDERAAIAGPHPASRDPTPSAVAVFNEQWERLVTNQPPNVRRIVELKLLGHKFREIADEAGVNERTARRIIKRLEARAEPPAAPLPGGAPEGDN